LIFKVVNQNFMILCFLRAVSKQVSVISYFVKPINFSNNSRRIVSCSLRVELRLRLA
jgi:hypothetical protein